MNATKRRRHCLIAGALLFFCGLSYFALSYGEPGVKTSDISGWLLWGLASFQLLRHKAQLADALDALKACREDEKKP